MVPLSRALSSSCRPGGARSQSLSIPEFFSMVFPPGPRIREGVVSTPFPLVSPTPLAHSLAALSLPCRPAGRADRQARGGRAGGRGEFRFRFFVQLQPRLRGRWRPGRVSSLWLRAAAPEPQEGRALRLPWVRAGLRGLPCEWARRRVKGCTAPRCPERPIR